MGRFTTIALGALCLVAAIVWGADLFRMLGEDLQSWFFWLAAAVILAAWAFSLRRRARK